MSEKIIVNVASYKRTESLIESLKSIIDQCDEINVALNDHYTQEIPDFLYHKKINLFLTDNSIGDAFKFLNLNKSDGYYLSIDDDLIYPSTYVFDTIEKCKEFKNKKVVTYHGRNFSSFPISSYYRSATERYACLNKVKNDVKVQFGGTGVMCFHTSLLKIPLDYFELPNMADIWIGKYCLENNIEIICLKHDEGYIKYIPQKNTIYDIESKSDKLQTDVVNKIFQKRINLTNVQDQKWFEIRERDKTKDENNDKYKVLSTIEKKETKINYNKVNSIFEKQQDYFPIQPPPKTNTIKLNSSMIPNFTNRNKKKLR